MISAAFGRPFCFFSPKQRPTRPHETPSDAPLVHNGAIQVAPSLRLNTGRGFALVVRPYGKRRFPEQCSSDSRRNSDARR